MLEWQGFIYYLDFYQQTYTGVYIILLLLLFKVFFNFYCLFYVSIYTTVRQCLDCCYQLKDVSSRQDYRVITYARYTFFLSFSKRFGSFDHHQVQWSKTFAKTKKKMYILHKLCNNISNVFVSSFHVIVRSNKCFSTKQYVIVYLTVSLGCLCLHLALHTKPEMYCGSYINNITMHIQNKICWLHKIAWARIQTEPRLSPSVNQCNTPVSSLLDTAVLLDKRRVCSDQTNERL